MNYFDNRSFNIGLITVLIVGAILIFSTTTKLPIDIIILNGLIGAFGFISLMKGITETNKAQKK